MRVATEKLQKRAAKTCAQGQKVLKEQQQEGGTCATRSSTSPPRSSRPLLAPIDEATSTAVGVARPSAQGQAMTNTSIASLAPSSSAALPPPAADAPATADSACGKSEAPAHGVTGEADQCCCALHIAA